MHHFDTYGWYTSEHLEGRVTDVAPTNTSETTTPGELRANFTGHIWIDLPYAVPAPVTVDPAPIIKAVTDGTQQRLDDFARTRNYDGILSACTYNLSSIPKFASEGQYCIDARDATWAALYQFMAEVQLGQKPMPTGYADVEPLLPPLVWPV